LDGVVHDQGIDCRREVAPDELFDVASIGLALSTLDGRMFRVNDALCELLGRDRDELQGLSWIDVTHPDDAASTQAQFEALADGRRRHLDLEKRYVRPDGSPVTAHVTSDVVSCGGTPFLLAQVRDVTSECEALAAVFATEQRWRSFTQSTADVFWVRDLVDRRFTYVSDSVFDMTGYAAAELYADPSIADRLVHTDDRHLLAELDLGIGAAGGALLRWLHRDGSVLWVEQRTTPVASIDGRPTEVVTVVRDVTDRVGSDMARARHDAQQRAVTAIAQTCIGERDHDVVLRVAIDEMERLVPADAIVIWWEAEPDGPFRLIAGSGSSAQWVGETLDADASHPARVRATGGVTSMQRRGALDAGPEDDVLDRAGIRSGVGVPVRSGGRVVGAIASYSTSAGSWGPEDVTFLQAVATTIGACADRARFDEMLAVQSLHDRVTGLPNRVVLLEHLGRALEVASDEHTVVVAVCDLDDFGLFNEAMGHDFGDRLLHAFAERLAERIDGALVARSGGDELACVIVCAADDPRIDSFGSEIALAMRTPLSLDGQEVAITCTVGLSMATAPARVDDVLSAALVAMHQAKARGRGLWMYSSGDEQARAVRQLDLTTALRRAVRDGGVAAYFQPLVDLRTDAVVGFEALARWVAPDGRFVNPEEFVPLAERTGLIGALGLSMLDQACELLGRVRDLGVRLPVRVSVNVSSRQLEDPDFPRDVAETLWRHGVPAGSVCLELTESALVPDDRVLIERLHVLKRIGVRLAIDDFGTGYSSFAYLTQFPIDLLKLDRAFVTHLQDDPRRLAVAHSIIGLANTLSIPVVAEGVETESEREALARLGCDQGQGFLWSRAVPLARAVASLVTASTRGDQGP
jgi:diguanylate cyclase (GGDEF)-like protein/PAS domain S-box-containing protein